MHMGGCISFHEKKFWLDSGPEFSDGPVVVIPNLTTWGWRVEVIPKMTAWGWRVEVIHNKRKLGCPEGLNILSLNLQAQKSSCIKVLKRIRKQQ